MKLGDGHDNLCLQHPAGTRRGVQTQAAAFGSRSSGKETEGAWQGIGRATATTPNQRSEEEACSGGRQPLVGRGPCADLRPSAAPCSERSPARCTPEPCGWETATENVVLRQVIASYARKHRRDHRWADRHGRACPLACPDARRPAGRLVGREWGGPSKRDRCPRQTSRIRTRDADPVPKDVHEADARPEADN